MWKPEASGTHALIKDVSGVGDSLVHLHTLSVESIKSGFLHKGEGVGVNLSMFN